jgi:AcrR family transcriptional regulator
MAPTESRRQPILAAMIRVVGENGYEEVAVEDVVAVAKISRTTFYEHFEGKQDCFLAAYEMLVDEVIGELAGAGGDEQAWTDRATKGLTAIVERLAADPVLARAAIVEVGAAGADARLLHRRAIDRLSNCLDAGRDPQRDWALPKNVSLMSAGAVSGLIFDDVVAGRADRLRTRLPDLVFAMLVPYLGPEAAVAEMRRVEAH